jgi:glycosyltransferase involved in cell wall biosynthesis
MNISVVIPVYNKISTIERSLLSVINQNTQVFEIILINDGSTDGSGSLIKKVIQDNPQANIKYIEQTNKGVSVARNVGIGLSTCDFICLLDADDIWDADFTCCLTSLIRDFPLANMYCLHHRIDRENSIFIPKHGLNKKYRGYIDDFFRASCFGNIAKTSKICIKKEVFSDPSYLFPEGVVAGEDLYVWIKVAAAGQVACDSKVACTVIQEEDNSRMARAGSTPYPLEYFSLKENKKNLTYQCKNYIALIGIKHVISDLLNLNFTNSLKRWLHIWKLSPIRAVFPFYLYYVFVK